jgi:hypothetical protein
LLHGFVDISIVENNGTVLAAELHQTRLEMAATLFCDPPPHGRTARKIDLHHHWV